MATIGFIGLGNMGAPMARNLLAAGHRLAVYDISPPAISPLAAIGAAVAENPAAATSGAGFVVTMLRRRSCKVQEGRAGKSSSVRESLRVSSN